MCDYQPILKSFKRLSGTSGPISKLQCPHNFQQCHPSLGGFLMLLNSMEKAEIWHVWPPNHIEITKNVIRNISPKLFSDPKFSQTQNFTTPLILFDPQFFRNKIFFDSKFCWTQNFMEPNFLGPKFYWTQKFFRPKFFWNQNFTIQKNLFDTQFFQTQNFLDPIFF